MTKNSLIELSIQVGLNGLSFSTLDRNTNTIDYFKTIDFNKKQTPFYLQQKLEDEFSLEDKLKRNFDKVYIIHHNSLSSLVPKALFNEKHLADYLKFNAKILQTDYITYDTLSNQDIINVYVPYVNINNFIYDKYGEFSFKHHSTILLDELLSHDYPSKKDHLIVNVSKSEFDIVVIRENKFLLYNNFEYLTKEDFIYYILFTVEQLNLDPETLTLEFYGNITEESDLYLIAYNYIRHIEFGNLITDFSFGESSPPTNNSHLTLLKSF